MEASATRERFGGQALAELATKVHRDKAKLLWLCPVLFAAIVWREIPDVYFVSDDFIDMKNIANDGALSYFVSPFAGHMIFTRNVEVILMYALFGLDEPEAYGWLMLATHLLNVAMFFRVVRSFTGSPVLAALAASLWGACPLYSEALGWPAVYGEVLCATFLLFTLDGIASRLASDAAISVRDALLWGLFLLGGATCFGGGIAVALIFPGVILALFPASQRGRRALLAVLALPVVVLVLYFGTQAVHAMLDAVPPDQKLMQSLALRSLWPPLKMLGYLLAIGTSNLLRGFAFPLEGYPHVVWWLVGLYAGVLSTAAWLGDNAVRRKLIVLMALAGAIYAMIAVGRANVYNMFGIGPLDAARQLRYHYHATVPVGLLFAVALAWIVSALRIQRLPEAALGSWLALNAVFYAGNPWRVNTQVDCRQYVTDALLEIDRLVDEQPVGTEVRIRNQELPRYCTGIFGYDAIPGWATLFLISNPENELRGRRVLFLEDVDRARTGRLGKLLVAAPASPDQPAATAQRAEDVAPSRHGACRDLRDTFARNRKLRGCKSDSWVSIQPVCEGPFERKPECVKQFVNALECLTQQAPDDWSCDTNGELSFGTRCVDELAGFLECMNE